MKKCIRCGADLEQNPIHAHWHHCPACEPTWVKAMREFNAMRSLATFATFAASDPRGRPTVGGIRE